MTSDLKIEIFACSLFREIFFLKGFIKTKLNIFQIYGEECCKAEKIYETRDCLYIKPIICRRKLFAKMYLRDLTVEKAKSLKSLSECYNYIISKCDCKDLFGRLTVFEKMFATCAFVIDFCIIMYKYNMIDVIEYGHMFWATYFDKHTEEFYARGGWPELKKAAEHYIYVDEFCFLFSEVSLVELREALNNYWFFINSAENVKLRIKDKKEICTSKLWVKFRTEQFESYTRTPPSFNCYIEALDVEEMLEDMKAIFYIITKNYTFTDKDSEHPEIPSDHADEKTNTNNYLEEAYYFEKIMEGMRTLCDIISKKKDKDSEHSEISSDYADEKTSTSNYLGIERLSEREYEAPNSSEVEFTNQMHEKLKYRKPPPYNIPGATIFACSVNESASGDKEVKTEKILEKSSGSTNEDDGSKIDIKTGTVPENYKSESECNGNTDNLYSRHIEKQYATSIVPEVLTIKRVDKSLCHKNHLCRVPESSNFCFQNAIVSGNDEDLSKKKTLEVTHNLNNGVDQIENTMKTGMPSASKMTKSELGGSNMLCTRQFDETNTDIFFSAEKERLKELLSKVSLILQMPESRRYGEITSNFLPTKQFIDTYIDNLYWGNTETPKETASESEVSTIQMHESEQNGETNLNSLLTPKVLHPANPYENNGSEMKEVDREQEDLRNEQDDRFINIFLRMILVLGDRQRAKLLFQEIQRIEGLLKTQFIPNKKKSKKKKKGKK